MKNLKLHCGFSLLELIVVVALLGLLTTMGIVKYQHLSNKSRQDEARINLANLITSEHVFNKEYGVYTSQLEAIGFDPVGQLNYNYGFSSNGLPVPKTFPANISFDPKCYATGNYTGKAGSPCLGYAQWTNSSSIVPTTQLPDSFPVNQPWLAFAASNLQRKGGPDIWSINAADNLVNIRPGF